MGEVEISLERAVLDAALVHFSDICDVTGERDSLREAAEVARLSRLRPEYSLSEVSHPDVRLSKSRLEKPEDTLGIDEIVVRPGKYLTLQQIQLTIEKIRHRPWKEQYSWLGRTIDPYKLQEVGIPLSTVSTNSPFRRTCVSLDGAVGVVSDPWVAANIEGILAPGEERYQEVQIGFSSEKPARVRYALASFAPERIFICPLYSSVLDESSVAWLEVRQASDLPEGAGLYDEVALVLPRLPSRDTLSNIGFPVYSNAVRKLLEHVASAVEQVLHADDETSVRYEARKAGLTELPPAATFPKSENARPVCDESAEPPEAQPLTEPSSFPELPEPPAVPEPLEQPYADSLSPLVARPSLRPRWRAAAIAAGAGLLGLLGSLYLFNEESRTNNEVGTLEQAYVQDEAPALAVPSGDDSRALLDLTKSLSENLDTYLRDDSGNLREFTNGTLDGRDISSLTLEFTNRNFSLEGGEYVDGEYVLFVRQISPENPLPREFGNNGASRWQHTTFSDALTGLTDWFDQNGTSVRGNVARVAGLTYGTQIRPDELELVPERRGSTYADILYGGDLPPGAKSETDRLLVQKDTRIAIPYDLIAK